MANNFKSDDSFLRKLAVGAAGTTFGVTLFDAADAGLVPTALVAVTVNV